MHFILFCFKHFNYQKRANYPHGHNGKTIVPSGNENSIIVSKNSSWRAVECYGNIVVL